MVNKLRNPVLFQGDLNKKNYFEGWYYKQVSADLKTTLSFIPGVSLNPEDQHSFIQYIWVQAGENGKKSTRTGYVRYPVNSFEFQEEPFAVKIGKSFFTERMIQIDLADENFAFKGQINLGPLKPIEQSVVQPNIMGIFAYIPKMECYHGVISMLHTLEGTLSINDHTYNFTQGKGYIEKDWGTSFPKHYIWLHSNHFKDTKTSLFFSIAHIPFHLTEFEGFIANLIYQGKEYRFATYNRSKCKIKSITPEQVQLTMENRRARLDITAQVSDRAELLAPVKGTMQKTVKEGISGELTIRLFDKETGETYEDHGINAGVEIVDYVFD